MTKNSGIRKPWMAEKTIPKPGSCRRSATIQNDGKNERDACRTIPSSMAPARRASRSDRRAKAGFSVLMEDVRPTSSDIEPGLPGLTDGPRRPGPPSQVLIRETDRRVRCTVATARPGNPFIVGAVGQGSPTTWCAPTSFPRSATCMAHNYSASANLVPTLRVGMLFGRSASRVSTPEVRAIAEGPRSGRRSIPTRSVGTRFKVESPVVEASKTG